MLRRSTLGHEGAIPKLDSVEDVELVGAMRAGAPYAPAAFYERVRPTIDRTLRRLLGLHDADFDDTVQEALIELVRSVDTYRGDGAFDGWIATVTARVAYRNIKKRMSERRMSDALGEMMTFSPPFADAEEESVARDLVERLRFHLGAMEVSKAWTYVLHDVHGYSLAEIATITEVTVAAAQSRLVRGRAEFEKRIAEDPELSSMLQKEGG